MPHAPGELTIETLPQVAQCLFEIGSPDTRSPVEDVMRCTMWKGDEGDYDFSLARQLRGILTFNPDTMLFTVSSAIPMADVFRGIYDELGQPQPKMGYVNVSSNLASELFERERLKDVVTGQRVAVIDEFVASGSTLRRAFYFCEALEATAVLPVAGGWYHNAEPSMIDYKQTSSTLAGKMRNIGRQVVHAEGVITTS